MHISTSGLRISRHFWHARAISSTSHTRSLRGVARTLIAGAVWRIASHGASGGMGRTWHRGFSCVVFVIRSSVTIPYGTAGHRWIIHASIDRTMVVLLGSSKSPKFSIAILLVSPCPELPSAKTGCIIVGRRRAVTFFSLVRTGEGNLKANGDHKEESDADLLDVASKRPGGWQKNGLRINDSDDKGSPLQLTRLVLAVSNGRAIDTCTRLVAPSS